MNDEYKTEAKCPECSHVMTLGKNGLLKCPDCGNEGTEDEAVEALADKIANDLADILQDGLQDTLNKKS